MTAEVGKVTINTELNVLSAVLTYARDTLRSPCASPKIARYKVRARKGNAMAYSREEVGYILAAAATIGADVFALVKFLFETGCRKSEAINLPWSRVDFERRLFVDQGADYAVIVRSPGAVTLFGICQLQETIGRLRTPLTSARFAADRHPSCFSTPGRPMKAEPGQGAAHAAKLEGSRAVQSKCNGR